MQPAPSCLLLHCLGTWKEGRKFEEGLILTTTIDVPGSSEATRCGNMERSHPRLASAAHCPHGDQEPSESSAAPPTGRSKHDNSQQSGNVSFYPFKGWQEKSIPWALSHDGSNASCLSQPPALATQVHATACHFPGKFAWEIVPRDKRSCT